MADKEKESTELWVPPGAQIIDPAAVSTPAQASTTMPAAPQLPQVPDQYYGRDLGPVDYLKSWGAGLASGIPAVAAGIARSAEDMLSTRASLESMGHLPQGTAPRISDDIVRAGNKLSEYVIPDSFWAGTLPQGLGSTLPPLAAGAFGGPMAALTTGMKEAGGYSLMETDQFAGIPEQDRVLAMNLNEILGATEAIPIMHWLSKTPGLDKLGSSFVKNLANHPKIVGTSKAAGDFIVKALEEGIQEVGQTIGENYIASDLVGYDPDRPLNQQVMEAFEAGVSTSAVLNLILQGVGYRSRSKALREITAEIEAEQANPNSPLTIAGKYVDVEELLKMGARQEELMRRYGEPPRVLPDFTEAPLQPKGTPRDARIGGNVDAFIPFADKLSAEKALSEGKPVYVVHEMDDEDPTQITDIDELEGYTADQLFTLKEGASGGVDSRWTYDPGAIPGEAQWSLLDNNQEPIADISEVELDDEHVGYKLAVKTPTGFQEKGIYDTIQDATKNGAALVELLKLGKEAVFRTQRLGEVVKLQPGEQGYGWRRRGLDIGGKPQIAYGLDLPGYDEGVLANSDKASVAFVVPNGKQFDLFIRDPLSGDLQPKAVPDDIAHSEMQVRAYAEIVSGALYGTSNLSQLVPNPDNQIDADSIAVGVRSNLFPGDPINASSIERSGAFPILPGPVAERTLNRARELRVAGMEMEDPANPGTMKQMTVGDVWDNYPDLVPIVGMEALLSNVIIAKENRKILKAAIKNETDPEKKKEARRAHLNASEAVRAEELKVHALKQTMRMIEVMSRHFKRTSPNSKILVQIDPNATDMLAYITSVAPGVYKVAIVKKTIEEALRKYFPASIAKGTKYTEEDKRRMLSNFRRDLFPSLIHEFGHALMDETISRKIAEARLKVLEGNPQESLAYQNLLSQLGQDYLRWVNLRLADREGIIQDFPSRERDTNGNYNADKNVGYHAYLTGANEFGAESFLTEWVMNAENLMPEGRKFAEEVRKDLEEHFTEIRARLGGGGDNLPQSVKDWVTWLSTKGKLEYEIETADERTYSLERALVKLATEFRREGDNASEWAKNLFRNMRPELDRFNWFQKVFWNLEQIVRDNPQIPGGQSFLQAVEAWQRYKIEHIARMETIVKKVRKLGKEQGSLLTKVLFDEDKAGKHLTGKELQAYKLSPAAMRAYGEIKMYFTSVLDEMNQALVAHYRIQYAEDPVKLQAKIEETNEAFLNMKARPYVPHMRFGRHIIGIRNPEGKLVNYDHAENLVERRIKIAKAKEAAAAMGPGHTYYTSEMSDVAMSLEGMPAPLLKLIKDDMPGITPEQKVFIDELLERNIPVKGFSQRFLKRRGVEGYSEDLVRILSAYSWSASSHMARLKYHGDMAQAVRHVRAEAQALTYMDQGQAQVRNRLANYMAKHMDYLLNPMNEWPMIRSLVFSWFLGMNIKSAVVNLSQVPLFTYPYLAARYGDAQAVKAITRANRQAMLYFRDPKKLSPEVQEFISWGIDQGFIDQSLAAEIAISASEGSMTRQYGIPSHKRIYYNVAHWAAMPFQAAEKMNRLVTGIAAYELARKSGKSPEQSRRLAKNATRVTQFENMRWNRPLFMQGKKGTLFIFANYIQNALHFALGGDPGALRAFLMFALLAGQTGIPFADDLLDLLDGVLTMVKERLGLKDPHTDLRRDLYEYVEQIGMDPELFLNGLARDSFGYNWVASKLGLPAMPSIDLSASMSMGNIIPGTEVLRDGLKGTSRSSPEFVGKLLEEAGGPFTQSSSDLLGAFASDNPDRWKRLELAMPAAIRQVSKAVRYVSRGEERTAGGQVIADFDTTDPIVKMELMLQAIGFTPTRLSQGYDEQRSVRDAVVYYQVLYRDTLQGYSRAVYNKDREAKADAWAAIQKYNRMVPFPEMKIDDKAMTRSVEEYYRRRIMGDLEVEAAEKYYRLGKDRRQPYDQGEASEP